MQINCVHVEQSKSSVHVAAISSLQLKIACYESKYIHVEARLRLTPFHLLIPFYGWKYVHMEYIWRWKPCVDRITLNTIRKTPSGNTAFWLNNMSTRSVIVCFCSVNIRITAYAQYAHSSGFHKANVNVSNVNLFPKSSMSNSSQ